MKGQYCQNKDPSFLHDIRKSRNCINDTIEKVKFDYIKNILFVTWKDPKKFWRNIKKLTEGDNDGINDNVFVDPDTGDVIGHDETPDFLNDFFANISHRLCNDNFVEDHVPTA